MNNRRYIKGNLRRGDFERVLLTDTAPYEVPIIVSNDGFYKNVTTLASSSPALREVVTKIVIDAQKGYSIPHRFKIAKDSLSVRNLSLLHPRSQMGIVDFYRKYDSLVCYYCSLGKFSIRRPSRVGSTFFFRSTADDRNQYKNDSVDTSDIDKFIRNPASFFTYDGVSRLYKFFSSSDFFRLEKKFENMILMDISKCFPSIYTHSVSWAVKSAKHSKDNTSAQSFGNDFDRLMQKMNYNETNGICIGPEVSRIFAEVILNVVDIKIEEMARSVGLVNGKEYECRRYVDDYIFFTRTKDQGNELYRITEECLSEFNLHLNEGKLHHYNRPFLTVKSYTINSAKARLNDFVESVTEKLGGFLVPKKIYRPDALIRSLVTSIKSGCYEQGVGYDMVSNYVIATLSNRIERLCADFKEATDQNLASAELYAPLLARLLEAIFFFYTVQPTVPSSFHVGRAVLILWRFLQAEMPDETLSASVQIQRWVSQLVRQHSRQEELAHRTKVPIEFLNVILAAAEVDRFQRVGEDLLKDFVFNPKRDDYFSLVSCLFYIKASPTYASMRAEVSDTIVKVLGDCTGVLTRAHDAHLALDAICCPYLTMAVRVEILRKVRKALALAARSNAELEVDVNEMAQKPWFVQWQGLDILNMIRKKELSAVY